MPDAEPDPIDELSHEHGALSSLLLAVREVLVRGEGGALDASDLGELRDGVEALHEELLTHFAREEESLLPFVIERFGAMRGRAESLRTDHEAVCRSAESLLAVAERTIAGGADVRECTVAFRALEEVYARHTQTELALLRDVDALLDPAARLELRALVAGT